MIDVLVYTKGLFSIPSIAGMTVSAPVLMNICFEVNSNRSPAVCTATTSGDTNEPSPVYTEIFGIVRPSYGNSYPSKYS